jgi:hypothetical protein
METGMIRRRVRVAAVVGFSAAALLLLSVPVMAEVARLTSQPLGKGTATVTWAGKSGISPTLNSVSGSAHGLPIAATGTVLTPRPGTPLSSTIPFLHVTGTLDGVPFRVDVSLTLAGVNLQSNKSQTFGAVTGSFRGQSVKAVLTGKPSSSTIHFKGTIGGDHVTGTIGKAAHRGNKSTAHATFAVTK